MMRQSDPSSGLGRLGSVVMVEDTRAHGVVLSTGLGAIELADTIVSPGSVSDAMRRIDAAATHLNADIQADTPAIMGSAEGQRFFNDWRIWLPAWQLWYSQNSSGYSISTQAISLRGDLVAHIRQLASEYNALEHRYTSITGHDPSYNPDQPSPDSWLGLPVAAWVGIGAGVVALGFVAWTASSVSKFAPATRALSGRRRKR